MAIRMGLRNLFEDWGNSQTGPKKSVSIITFGRSAKQLLPLTAVENVQFPTLRTSGDEVCLGAALRLLIECRKRKVRPPCPAKVFVFMGGNPTDQWISVAEEIGKENSVCFIVRRQVNQPEWEDIILWNNSSIVPVDIYRQEDISIIIVEELKDYSFAIPPAKDERNHSSTILSLPPDLIDLVDMNRSKAESKSLTQCIVSHATPKRAMALPGDVYCVSCGECGTPHHVGHGMFLPAECPACTEKWDVIILYHALRPTKRHAKVSNGDAQNISDELKQKWKQMLPQFNDICSWSQLDGFDLAWVLCVCPECVCQMPFKALDSKEWRMPLQKHEKLLKPYWAVCNGTSHEISEVLCANPSMVQYVDVSARMEARHWWAVLDVHPDLAHNTPDTYYVDMPPKTWVQILKRLPQSSVETKTPWASLSGSHWAELLLSRPELAVQCDWHKLGEQDWNSILAKPSTPPLWTQIHDVLRGHNLACILEHPELQKYLDWDTAPLEDLRELIVLSDLNIQPKSWDALSARIAGEKAYWRPRQSIPQFVPQTTPGEVSAWTANSLEKVDLTSIDKYENKLALLCFMGWEFACNAEEEIKKISVELFVRYPGIGEKCGWKIVPDGMHYDLVRMAPWLREYYSWSDWPKAQLQGLFDADPAFKTEYKKKHLFKYINFRYERIIYISIIIGCCVGAGLAFWRYEFLQFQKAIIGRNIKAAESTARYLPSMFCSKKLNDLRELIDLHKKSIDLQLLLEKYNAGRLVPADWSKASAAMLAASNLDDLQQAKIATSNILIQLGSMYEQVSSMAPLYREMLSTLAAAHKLMAKISSHGLHQNVKEEIAELEYKLESLDAIAQTTNSYHQITKQIQAWQDNAAALLKSLNTLTEAWNEVVDHRERARTNHVPRLLPRGWELAELKRTTKSKISNYEEAMLGYRGMVDEYDDLVQRADKLRQIEVDILSLHGEVVAILHMIRTHTVASHASSEIDAIQHRYEADPGTNAPPSMLYDSKAALTSIRDDCQNLLGELNAAAAKHSIFAQKYSMLGEEREYLRRLLPDMLAEVERKAASLGSINKLSAYDAAIDSLCADIDALIDKLDAIMVKP